MDLPGMSLFQGTESLQINTSAQQRIEEEDALEDQKRRNEELKNELQNAFDDLEDEFDDEDEASDLHQSIDSVAKSPAVNGVYKNAYTNGVNKPNGGLNSVESDNEIRRLQQIIASKDSELKHLTAINKQERLKYENQIDEFKKRLAITEAEKERAHMSRKQTHELFVESKQKIAEREEKISELQSRIKILDGRNADLLTELEHSKALITDLQHKYLMVERSANLTSDKHTDIVVKQLNDKYAAQADMMQQQINNLRSKLEDRDIEMKRLMIQNNELHQSREAMLIDKSDTINQLSHKLEESQRQCQNLLMKNTNNDGDLFVQNKELMRKMSAMEGTAEEMRRTINELTMRLERTAVEIETASADTIANGYCSTPLTRFPSRKTFSARSEPLGNAEDHLRRMKQEFNRCLEDLKTKRQEILSLKDKIASQTNEIERLKMDENHNLIELNTSRERIDRLESKLKFAENELRRNSGKNNSNTTNDEKSESQQHVHDLQDKLDEALRQNKNLREKLNEIVIESNNNQDVETHLNEMKKKYSQMKNEKDHLEQKLLNSNTSELQKEILQLKSSLATVQHGKQLTEVKCNELVKALEQMKEEFEAIRKDNSILNTEKDDKNSTNNCKKCMNLSVKITELEIENLQLQTTCTAQMREINDLKKSLKHSKKSILEMESQLTLKEEHDKMLHDLKIQAEQFKIFMKNQSPNGRETLALLNNSNCSDAKTKDQCISIDGTIDVGRCESSASGSVSDRSAERKIREEMAKAMAVQMKASENQFKEKIIELEEQIQQYINELGAATRILELKENDITALKECILKERAAIQDILKHKDTETSEEMQRMEATINEIHNELVTAHKRIEYLVSELDESNQQYYHERESTQKLINEWKTEVETLVERENYLLKQINKMENEHKKTIQMLNEKYTAAKKTAANYKKYSEDKEEHIKRESERIKHAYEVAVKKCKENMETAINEHKIKYEKKISEFKAKNENGNE